MTGIQAQCSVKVAWRGLEVEVEVEVEGGVCVTEQILTATAVCS